MTIPSAYEVKASVQRRLLIEQLPDVGVVAWRGGRLLGHDDPQDDVDRQADAVRQQEEQRLGGRIDRMAQWAKGVAENISDLKARVDDLELHVGPDVPISEQQAAEVALAVKQVGRALSDKDGKPGYGQVYVELYRRYGISSYKNLPQDRYDEVMAWLKGWHDELTSETTS
ncbi:hypothetical protein EKD04_023505 [Chloroflexales bacterium ZM16-3]|nr:hypothetical protein [Chloroflexales bacterium ZM16-3]